MLRSELEDETLYFKLGNSLGTNYSKRVLKIPPRAIAAFDPAMLGVTGMSPVEHIRTLELSFKLLLKVTSESLRHHRQHRRVDFVGSRPCL